MPLSAGELYDALGAALDAAPRRIRWLPWRSVVWLTRPTLQVRGRSWTAVAVGKAPHTYGYSVWQARQIRAALLAVMGDADQALHQTIAYHGKILGL